MVRFLRVPTEKKVEPKNITYSQVIIQKNSEQPIPDCKELGKFLEIKTKTLRNNIQKLD